MIPWLAAVIYCLLGQRPRQDVPFLELWQDLHGPKPRHRRFAMPPAAVIFGLLAALLGIIAASRPAWLLKTPGAQQISLIIDRGVTMSARGQSAERYKELTQAVASEFQSRFGRRVSARVLVVPPVPGGASSASVDFAGIPSYLESLAPTARDTCADLNLAVLGQLAEPSRLVLVVSDRDFAFDNRLMHIATEHPPSNVGIRVLAARQTPTTQVMVSVRNDSLLDSAVIEVRSGEHRQERTISLPAMGQAQSHFFDLPSFDELIGCRIVVTDDLPADNVAVLRRSRRWPRLEVVGAASEAVLRMIDTYQRQCPADADSTAVVIARDVAAAGDRPAVILAFARTTPAASTTPATLAVSDHPVTANLANDFLGADLRVAASPPAGFEPILRRGEQTLLAIRPEPRQVWVGFESDELAARPAFVVLWTNLFNWAGRGGDTFSSTTVEQIADTWRLIEKTAGDYALRQGPGVYERLDGTAAAVNVAPVNLPKTAHSNWHKRLDSLDLRQITSRRELSQWMLLGAMCAFVLAIAAWPSRYRPASR